MEKCYDDAVDTQFSTENIAFLENCFDNSFTLQASLQVIKDYLAEDNNEISTSRDVVKKQNKTLDTTETSKCNKSVIQSQSVKCGILSKNLKDWGLPHEIANKYESRGITEMFDWQVTCLGNPKVLMDCCNLVYSAPTSAGKTLIAEIITIKTILERQKKVIIILPFVSIVREKMYYLQDILSSSGIRVEGFMGSQSPPGGLQSVHVAICTIEKANSLVNRLLDDGSISDLGAVIVDELHLLGDPHRGYILELLLTKIKFVSTKFNEVKIQVVGMSATLPNLEVLANWLDAELFVTHFRPIPLDEFCLVGNKYYNKNGEYVNSLFDKENALSEYILKICLDTISEGCSILIFCMTKNRCENLAQSIASSFYKLGCSGNEMGNVLRQQLKSDNIFEVLEQLRNCPVSLDQVLKSTISFGVAYHHAGLTFDERDIIEGAFKSGAIKVLVATSTLSSGVNLPARKVIIRSPVFQRQPINILTYKQMMGRAGRMGRDLKGESILICTEAEKKIGFNLMMGALDPVKSCIKTDDKFMRAVLEMIASQVVCTINEIELYAKCTLLFIQQGDSDTQSNLLSNNLNELTNNELVRIQKDGDEDKYIATPLGKACLSSSMAPNDGLSLFCELQKARQCLVLETDLHLIYLVTPYSVSSQWGEIDWLHMLTLWESLTKAMKRVGELVGVQESFIIRCLRGGNKTGNSYKLNIHKRFYTALALQDLVNEVPLSEVAAKYQCARGFLQSLQQSAATFAGMVTAFCHQLGWKNMEMLISQFQDRLHFGIHSELLELMKLSSLNGVRARSLFDNGFENITSIASGDVHQIENALYKAVPFQSERERDDDDSDDVKKRNKIKNVWITGCCAMSAREAAENLIIEARKYLAYEIGGADIKWDKNYASNVTNEQDAVEKRNHEVVEIKSDDNKLVIPYLKKKIDTQEKTVCIQTTLEPKLNHNDITEISLNNVVQNENIVNIARNTLQADNITNDVRIAESIQIKDIPINNIVNIDIKANKDESLWDSLNFNMSSIENVTKVVKVEQNVFSPNVSFGVDGETSIIKSNSNNLSTSRSMSVKDISLFSSDGDNSSLFEDSLPLDLIPSKLLEEGKPNLQKQGQWAKHEISDLVNMNSNTMLNAFKSTIIELDDDEDIKLVYDDGKEILNECNSEFNASADLEIDNTQNVNDILIKKSYVSPYKRQMCIEDITQRSKKVKTDINPGIPQTYLPPLENFNISRSSIPFLSNISSKMITLRFINEVFNCFILKEDDILKNLNILSEIQTASLYMDIKQEGMACSDVIGGNIFGVSKPNMDIQEKSYICPINSINVYYNSAKICLHLDLSSVCDVSKILLIKEKLRQIFSKKTVKWKILSLRSVFIYVKRFCGAEIPLTSIDISLVEWLIDSDDKTRNINYLAKKYCDIDPSDISVTINESAKKIKNLEPHEDSCLKSYLLWVIAEKQSVFLLQKYHSMQSTVDIEIEVSKILSNCEYYGVSVNKDLASQLLIDVKNSQETLQKKAFKICGYHFNFNSSKDVAKVLGMFKGRKVSTKKSVLTAHNSPMSSIIIYWRKLNSILTKTLYPLTEKACIYTEGDRINPTYTMFTCTGRVSMHEPNLQNVPRTFLIPAKYLSPTDENTTDVVEFNCRNIFRAAAGFVLVSADYCQLEMRILTHYSEDPVLLKIMRSNEDVFKSIAASWGCVSVDQVDEDLRQKAKQLCYGILYGMGNRTLAQNLDVPEIEAAVFMDSFYKTYPAIKAFTLSIIEDCRCKGYVETLMKRRRYLPDIKSLVSSKRCAAERQAVNTTIQGSAADIAKAAMCAIDQRTASHNNKPRLILQMHDELIYEVPESDGFAFVSILKEVMEETVKLKVPLPVKVKSGLTWGSLQEIQI